MTLIIKDKLVSEDNEVTETFKSYFRTIVVKVLTLNMCLRSL